MKLCTHCGRKYPDETLNFCLDDGSQLLYGPADEHPTLLQPAADDGSEHQTVSLSQASPSHKDQAKQSGTGSTLTARRPLLIGVAAIGLMLVIGLAVRYQFRTAATGPASEIHSIAVLPLEDLSGDPSQEYFSDGMTDALISDLAQIRSIKVISRTSVMSFKGSRKPLPEIARALGVDAIVEGTVTRAGGRVRVSAQLIPATTDTAVWSRNYEREMSDVLRLQSEVAQSIVTEIKAQLTSSEQHRLNGAKAVDPNASEEFLLGKYHLQKHSDASLEQAIGHFTKAIEIDPNYAEAWAGLSSAWFERGIWGNYSHSDVESASRNAALKALALDPDLSSAYTAMANLNSNYDWDWPSTEKNCRKAIELDPSNSNAYDSYAWYLLNFGRFDEVRQAMSTAEQLDPVSSNIQSDFGRMLYRARDFAAAEIHLRRAIELDEKNTGPYDRLADVYLETRRFDEALALYDKVGEMGGGQPPVVRKAVLFARMGQKQKALDLWNSVTKKNPAVQARISTELGDFDAAFQQLNSALDEHQTVLPHVRVDPGFDKLHSDPRWAQFLARMNLPPS